MTESPFARAETFKGSPLTEAERDLLKSMIARIGMICVAFSWKPTGAGDEIEFGLPDIEERVL